MAPQEVQVQETIEEEVIIQDVQEGIRGAVVQEAEEATWVIE